MGFYTAEVMNPSDGDVAGHGVLVSRRGLIPVVKVTEAFDAGSSHEFVEQIVQALKYAQPGCVHPLYAPPS